MDGRREEQLVLAGLVYATPCLLGIGGSWDAHWHWTVGRDTLWLPAHMLLYAGIALNALLAAFMYVRGRRDPATLLVASGVGTIFGAAIFDGIWHITIGDRMVWSPPHVLFVVGSMAIGCGMAAAFIRAGRLNIVSQATVTWGVRTIVTAFLIAAYFGLVPTAMLVFHPEAADKTLLFEPTPMTLLILLSGVMPATMILAIRAVGVAALPVLMGTTIAFWCLQQAFHLVFTGPVAGVLGYAVKTTPLLAWPFELAVFAVAMAPLALIGPRLGRQPELAGAVAGAYYAVAVQLWLILADAPARVNPGVALFSILLGTVGAYAATWFADWIWAFAGLIPRTKPRTS